MTKEISNNERLEKDWKNLSGMLQSSPPSSTQNKLLLWSFHPYFLWSYDHFLSDLLKCFFSLHSTVSLSLFLRVSLRLTSGSSPSQVNLRWFLGKISSANTLNSYTCKGRLWSLVTQTIKDTGSIKSYLGLHNK